jgi:hypothetical protein
VFEFYDNGFVGVDGAEFDFRGLVLEEIAVVVDGAETV